MAENETTFVKGRGKKTALILLTAAAQLEHEKYVVQAQLGGYKVPTDVAERYEELLTELDKGVADEESKQAKAGTSAKATEAKAPAKKRTAAKKTAATKTTAKSAAAEPQE